ncbi:MAG: hypothetical protein JW841_03120 [Deltaproteobacteria bacterium]|nr:hypothetical protein [Deltaproteobacteria bacterium]
MKMTFCKVLLKSQWLALAASIASIINACATSHPPIRFVNSPAFHSIAGRVHGIVERDLDKDGHKDAVVAIRSIEGYRFTVLRQQVSDNKQQWLPQCTSEQFYGEEIDALRFTNFGSQAVVFTRILSENPEEAVQAIGLIDVANGCKSLFAEQIKYERGEVDNRIAPPGFYGGSILNAEGTSLLIVDEPQYLHLGGPNVNGGINTQKVLMSVRHRQLHWPFERLQTEQSRHSLFFRAPLIISKKTTSTEQQTEQQEASIKQQELHVPANEKLQISLKSDVPLVMLEIHHGCLLSQASLELSSMPLIKPDNSSSPTASSVSNNAVVPTSEADSLVLTLLKTGKQYHTGKPPLADSFVKASGFTNPNDNDYRDLLILQQPENEIVIEVGPDTIERCIRKINAFSYTIKSSSITLTAPTSINN